MQTYTPEQYKAKYGDKGAWASQTSSSLGRPTISQTIGNAFKGSVDQIGQGVRQVGEGGANPLQAVGNLVTGVGKVGSGAIGAVFSPLAPITEPLVSKPLQSVADKLAENPTLQRFSTTGFGKGVANVAENVANYANIAGTVGGVMEVPKIGSTIKTGATNLVEDVGNAFDSVTKNVSKYPKQIADKITMGKIDTRTQTILKETPSSIFDKYVKAGEEAVKDPRKFTPLEIAGQEAENVVKSLKESMGKIGQQKTEVLDSVKTTRAVDVATKQIEKIKPLLQKKLTDSERGLLTQYLDELNSLGKKPTAGSVDATIDKLQATLFEKSKGVAVPMTTRIKSFINKSIGELNSDLKAVVDKATGNTKYSDLNAAYAERINIFNKLNKALGEDAARGGSLMKRFFSPQDSGIKSLFKEIKNNYGIDLGKDATIAKFVMDTLGDTRARSLLQLPPLSKMGLASRAVDFVEKKLTSPEAVIKKARTMTKP